MIRRRALAMIILFVLSLAGCSADAENGTKGGGNSSGGAKAGDGPSRGTIGVSMMTLENPFFKVIADNITAEAEKNGYEVNVLDARDDRTIQSNQLDDFVVQKVSAIILSPVEAKAIVPAVKRANEAGIPVITVDVPCFEEGIEFLTQIATDNYSGGKEAARAMIEVLGKTGGKIVILHKSEAESCRERVRGFTEIIDAHNADAGHPIEVVQILESKGAKEDGFNAMSDALQSHPDLAGVFAINDPAALGAYSAIEKAQKTDQITIVGFDGMPQGKRAIKEGKIYADPIQFPDKMGIKAVESLVLHFRGEDVPKNQPIATYLYRQEDALKDPELK